MIWPFTKKKQKPDEASLTQREKDIYLSLNAIAQHLQRVQLRFMALLRDHYGEDLPDVIGRSFPQQNTNGRL